MTKYDQGRRFEWKTRDDLTPNGYEVVRAAGSKGKTKIDLIAIKPGQLLFIQCKEDGKLGPAEWDRVHEVAGWVGAIPLLAANGPRGRGVVYTRLLGPKVPRARTQPCEPFLLDEIAAVLRPAPLAGLYAGDRGRRPSPECLASLTAVHADCDGCTCACHRLVPAGHDGTRPDTHQPQTGAA